MAGNTCAGSIQACMMRVSRLDAAGTTPVSATGMYVTDALVRMVASPEIEAGEEIVVKNACGVNALSLKSGDQTKRYNVELGLVNPDPELIELLVAGTLLVLSGPDSVGFGVPRLNTVPTDNGVAIELWSKAVIGGVQATTLPWWRWAFPRTYQWKHGERNWENAAMANVLTGIAVENAAFGNGPTNDWTGPTDRAYAGMRVATIPTSVCGYQAVPTQT